MSSDVATHSFVQAVSTRCSPLWNASRSANLLILPEPVSGYSFTQIPNVGVFCGESLSRTNALSVAGGGRSPSFARMNQATCAARQELRGRRPLELSLLQHGVFDFGWGQILATLDDHVLHPPRDP
jgi:hypothetical protein